MTDYTILKKFLAPALDSSVRIHSFKQINWPASMFFDVLDTMNLLRLLTFRGLLPINSMISVLQLHSQDVGIEVLMDEVTCLLPIPWRSQLHVMYWASQNIEEIRKQFGLNSFRVFILPPRPRNKRQGYDVSIIYLEIDRNSSIVKVQRPIYSSIGDGPIVHKGDLVIGLEATTPQP